ncbi:uncharacterized protein LOC128306300 [Anopheles moucheti]|uniref:uncharacterized protein LOC128306300 n=1 Tax=Anopheles moucheti TaxID=186751 RepID=UPI0022EFE182|nr:uncharacterized protein LOC128306300 [Anopheles moucheti]
MVLLQLRSLRSWLVSSDRSLRDTLNSIFWLSWVLGIIFLQFRRLVERLLRLGRVKASKHGRIVQHLWNISFYTSATIFLLLYQMLLIRPEVVRESGKYFPQYNNVIFASACDPAKFEIITVVLVSYRVLSTVSKLSSGDYSVAFSSALCSSLLMCCLTLRLENYSILLNLYLAIYITLEETFLLCASQTDRKHKHKHKLTVLVLLMCGTWIYLFFYLLPFEFLIPTLYARRELFPLKLCFWLWYCSCVWNSPLLKLLYHKIYHTHANDCAGGASAVRCILSNDWQSFRHFRNLKHAHLMLVLHQSNRTTRSVPANEKATLTAFQTIKCVVSLKRKLRRLRENKEQLDKYE